jgi:hypothetical protein
MREDMKEVTLRNGIIYKINDRVEVPDPSKGENWNYSFVGKVAGFEKVKDDLFILVKDYSEQIFRINPYRLKSLSIPVAQARTAKDDED